jgi:hypothetical protein
MVSIGSRNRLLIIMWMWMMILILMTTTIVGSYREQVIITFGGGKGGGGGGDGRRCSGSTATEIPQGGRIRDCHGMRGLERTGKPKLPYTSIFLQSKPNQTKHNKNTTPGRTKMTRLMGDYDVVFSHDYYVCSEPASDCRTTEDY